MNKEFDLEAFTRLVVRKTEELGKEVSLANPTDDAIFPIGVVNNPMEDVVMTDDDNIPIIKNFSITIEWWTNSRYESMKLCQETNLKMRTLNLLKVGNTIIRNDEVTSKYIVGETYEVRYNGLTNSLEKIK